MVLLHGFCESHAVFRHILPALRRFSDPFTPDFPGFGGKPHDPHLRSLDDLACWLRDLLDELQLEKVVLAGHSMGGYVAMAFAEFFPERLLALGMLHSTSLPDTPDRQLNRSKTIAFIEAHGVRPFLDVFVPSLFHDPKPAWLAESHAIAAQADPQAIIACARMMRDRPDRSMIAAALEIPLMYITGTHDALVTPERNREEWAGIPMAVKKIVDGAGHMGMYENPEAVIEALESLVESVPRWA